MRAVLVALALFVATALAEIVGCFLVYRWLREDASAWWLGPAGVALAAFAYLLTLHPGPAGRTYAAYGAVYVTAALLWMALIEGRRPTGWDLLGAGLCLAGMAVIVAGARSG